MIRIRFDLSELRRLPKDIDSFGSRLNYELNQAMSESAVLIREDIRSRYRTQRIGGRSKPTMASGNWGNQLQIVTRGTGSTLGRSYVIIQESAAYAGELESGQGVGQASMRDLTAWAMKKFGADPKRAAAIAKKIIARGETSPVPLLSTYDLTDVEGELNGLFSKAIDNAIQASKGSK